MTGGLPRLVHVEIDAAALRHNLAIVRRYAPRSKVMAVIKSDGYGHGLIEVARALQGADALAVATLEEALALRAVGVASRIVLLDGIFGSQQLAAAVATNIEMVVHERAQIELLRAAPQARLRVWLKLDSGMNRLGFGAEDFREAHRALGRLACTEKPLNLLTHLACADVSASPVTARQLEIFDSATAGLDGERCVANSAAVITLPAAHRDWVRPGLMLYGASPFAAGTGADHGLRAVMTVRARIIAVKRVSVGHSVGYGAAWTAARPTLLAVAGAGYGDGYPRHLSSGTPVLVNGERAALAGRVSMGMIGIDATDLQRAPALGDEVILWGAGLPVEEIARCARTIPYELLCGIHQRIAARVE